MSKVFPIDVVICFDENLSQSALSYGVVLCVELVKSMKGVPILQQNSLFRFQRNVHHQNTCTVNTKIKLHNINKTLISLFNIFLASN